MADEQVQRVIGSYRLIRKLGCGSFGCVYLGQHIHLPNQLVAVKLFLGQVDAPHERKQFLHEAQLLDQVRHPCILAIHDVAIQENPDGKDLAYLITDYAPNGSLRDRLLDAGARPLSLQETFKILSRVGEGLQYAHQRQVVHRDLKPENILFNASREAVLADFGIAIILSSGTRIQDRAGTPAYMAPEQFQGIVSRKSDQYALACIAYEMLTGQHPFPGMDNAALAYQQQHRPPQPPRQLNPVLPTHVEQALLTALAKDRQQRYPDVATFLEALQSDLLPLTQEVPHNKLPVHPFEEEFFLVDREGAPSFLHAPLRPARGRSEQEQRVIRYERPRVNPHKRGKEPMWQIQRAIPRPRVNPHKRGEEPMWQVNRAIPRPRGQRSLLYQMPQPMCSQRTSRQWGIVLSGGFGLLGSALALLLVIVPPTTKLMDAAIVLFAGSLFSLLWCVLWACVKSYHANRWGWFIALLTAFGGLTLLGTLFLGWQIGVGLGTVIAAIIGIVYPTKPHVSDRQRR